MKSYPLLTRSNESLPTPGIVHLGPGAFFRAFNAIYTADAMAESTKDWGIVAVSLKSPTARDQLVPQGCAYTSVTLNAAEEKIKIIESIVDVLVAPENPLKVIEIMAQPNIQIVSLTITEKGYCYEPATGNLKQDHPDIINDLSGQPSKTAIGFIVAALARRKAAGIAPFTILPCDNLPANGQLTRRIIVQFSRILDAELAQWVEDNVCFPSTMVDGIVPATTADDITRLAEKTGYIDNACVCHEPYRQWVIEDDFNTQRPAWKKVGVQFVENVDLYEKMKLRCLNGTHSTLAYLGYLAGYETIAEAVADKNYAKLCEKLWAEEILPTFPDPESQELVSYSEGLLRRYQNPAIRHKTWQIAMDGSQKLPQRILGTISDNLNMGHLPLGLILTVAAWMRYVGGVDEQGKPIEVKDPMAERLYKSIVKAETDEQQVDALLAENEIFNPQLANNALFKNALIDAYKGLKIHGSKAMVADFCA